MRTTKKEMLEGIENITESKIIDANTVRYKTADNDNIHIRLHNTDIITIAGNYIILHSGGWKTNTTKTRINTYQDICTIIQNQGIWTVKTNSMESMFYDGIKITTAGKIIKPLKEDKKTARILKQINNYCKKLKGLKTLPEPSAGDCFYCRMRTVEGGQPLGKVTENTNHLLQHLSEKYIHGSLILNALKSVGYSNPAYIFNHLPREGITRAVRRYFKRHLGVAQ